MPAPATGNRPELPVPLIHPCELMPKRIIDVAPRLQGDDVATTRPGIGDVVLAVIESVVLVGTEAYLVRAEVDANATGLPKFVIVGLPAKSVREAEQRVRSAINASERTCPNGRTVANLAPGGLRKEGTHFDLPLALGILASSGQLPGGATDGWVAMGELSLGGEVRAVRGVLAAAIECKRGGRRGLICPETNAAEASLVEGIEVVGVTTLQECIDYFKGEWTPRPIRTSAPDGRAGSEDMSEVRGHRGAKRAVEIAAAGGHNLLTMELILRYSAVP